MSEHIYIEAEVKAIVRTALKVAQGAIRGDALNGDLSDGAAQWAVDTIQSIADDAEVAAIIKKAMEDRV
jgi:uncharacterized lipoprotein YajG